MKNIRSILTLLFRRTWTVATMTLLFSCNMIDTRGDVDSKMETATKNGPSLHSLQNESEKTLHSQNFLNIKSRILNQYSSWKGVRYRLGGNTKKGIDCSAFVQLTFREQFKLELPRSTYGQSKIGKSVSRANLREGDLLLFRVNSRSRHVGIYIGNNQFIHASTSNGVTMSSLDQPYWKNHYSIARRILKDR